MGVLGGRGCCEVGRAEGAEVGCAEVLGVGLVGGGADGEGLEKILPSLRARLGSHASAEADAARCAERTR